MQLLTLFNITDADEDTNPHANTNAEANANTDANAYSDYDTGVLHKLPFALQRRAKNRTLV